MTGGPISLDEFATLAREQGITFDPVPSFWPELQGKDKVITFYGTRDGAGAQVELLSFHADGTVTTDPTLQPDEAARQVLDHICKMFPDYLKRVA